MILTKTDKQQSQQDQFKYLLQKNTGLKDSRYKRSQYSMLSKDSQSGQKIDKCEEIYEDEIFQQQNSQEINAKETSSAWQKLIINNHKHQSTQIFEQQSTQIFGKNTISIYDKAEAVKNNLLKKLDIFMDQMYIFEDQYYPTKESCDQYHPNCLADKCLENIEKITDLLEKTIKQIEKVSGNKQKTKFHYTDQIQYSTKFENLQGQEYQLQFIQFYEQTIIAYDCSIQDRILACCFNNTIALFDMKQLKDISKINHLRGITAIKFYEDETFNFIVGDNKGFVSQYNPYSSEQLYQYQLHYQAICQILIKDNSNIFTSSIDNTIKLTNIEQFQTIRTIDYVCSCFSGFDYSFQDNFLIAPNNQSNLSIWDASEGQLILSKSIGYKEDQFIAIQLSSNSKKVLVNLFKLYTILLFEIKYDLKEILLIKQIKLHNSVEKCINFQWCLDDTAFIYFHQSYYEIRNLEQKNIPLIFQECVDGREDYVFERGFVNKLNKDLNYLVAIFDNEVQILKKSAQNRNKNEKQK